jgi:2-dehydro-3-deoxyphosphogluconate aldolase/(4S)-4-hydroxy-2-oxoglutarate aldolase
MDISEFERMPLLGILRGIGPKDVEPLTETMIASGLRTAEITMNTEGAAGLIKKMVKCADGRLTVGAGTVLDVGSLKKAVDSGATFIVSPVRVPKVMAYCVKHQIPVFPGALTPQEIYEAWESGATMVKVFPAKFFGPEYFKEIKGPFSQIKLLACSGVTPGNLKNYFENGASAVAIGASVFKDEWLQKKDYKSLGTEIRKFTTLLKRRMA